MYLSKRFAFRLAVFAVVMGSWRFVAATQIHEEASKPEASPEEQYRACGVNSLYVVMQCLGVESDLTQLEALLNPDADGSNTMLEIRDVAVSQGLHPVPVRVGKDQLSSIPAPAIMHVRELAGEPEGNHFVVYLGQTESKQVLILDPPTPSRRIPPGRFQRLWTGVALAIFTDAEDADAFAAEVSELPASEDNSTPFWMEPFLWLAVGQLILFSVILFGAYREKTTDSHPRRVATAMLIAGSLAGILGCGSSGTPHVVFDRQVFEFGVIPDEGKDLSVPIKNDGDGPLIINAVQTSCACTLASTPPRIEPGETKEIVIRPPHGRRAAVGPVTSRLVVISNDRSGPHEIALMWINESPPALDPPRLHITDAVIGTIVERPVRITYAGGEERFPLEILESKSSFSNAELKQVDSQPVAKHSWRPVQNDRVVVGETTFSLRLPVPQSPGTVTGNCVFRVRQAGKEYVLDLPVEIEGEGVVTCAPRLLFLSARKPEALVGQQRKFKLIARTEANVTPVVSDLPDYLSADIEAGDSEEGRKSFELTVSVTRPPKDGESGAAIAIELPDHSASRIELPVTIHTVQ